MALKYSCPYCRVEITAQYLQPGEPCLCQSCKKYSAVPQAAVYINDAVINELQRSKTSRSQPIPVYGKELADRCARLGAAIIDGALIIPFYVLFIIAIIVSEDNEPLMGLTFLMLLLFGLALLGVQIYLLTTLGQTIGKKLLKIKIVKFDTGQNGGFVPNVLLRAVFNGILTSIPFAGAIYALVDILFIFADDRRCLHDHIAGTKVVKSSH